MLALRKLSAEPGPPELAEVPIPVPRPGEVRIAVTATGLCGTDFHTLAGEYVSRPPVTLGHEIAGRVDAVGAGVDESWLGALVSTETPYSTCGACRWCRSGKPMLCAQRLSIGSGVDGGFASHVVAPAINLHRIPDWVGDHAAALAEPLACVCNALLDPNAIEPGDRVVVVGAGAIGMLAGQVARAAGGRVLMLGTEADVERLATATSFGFETCRIEQPDESARLDAEIAAREIDVVIECSGSDGGIATALTALRPQGTLIQMGLHSGNATIPYGEIVIRELAVRAALGGSPAGWLRVEELLEARLLDPRPLVSSVLPLREWPLAFERFDRREGIKNLFDPRLS
jgi:L-iditol 2-dehydrogenase